MIGAIKNDIRGDTPLEERSAANIRDVQRHQALADVTVVPRCPRCRAPLVARMTCRGPSFTCLCEDRRFG
jgi:hypothetical protein